MLSNIQIVSDIHLEKIEFYNESKTKEQFKSFDIPVIEKIIKPCSSILVLAGDIGNPKTPMYKRFLEWCKFRFEYVFLTPGNHEYYGLTIEEGNYYLVNVCKRTGVILLNNTQITIPELDVTFFGTTLWSYIPQQFSFEIYMCVNDFSKIKGLTVDLYNEMHKKSKEWLSDALSKSTTKNNIVITHHSPLLEITSHPFYRGKTTNYAFQSDCTDLMEKVNVWIFGHTHFSVDINHENCRVVSNQLGYEREGGITGYTSKKSIEF